MDGSWVESNYANGTFSSANAWASVNNDLFTRHRTTEYVGLGFEVKYIRSLSTKLRWDRL